MMSRVFSVIVLPALGLGALLGAPAAGREAAPPLSWTDLEGRRHAAARRGSAATVLLFGSTTCPCADGYNARAAELVRRFGPRGVRFFQLFSAPGESAAGIARYGAARKIAMPLVHDRGAALARRLGAESTPAAVLLDARGRVRYRGRIDDNPDPQAVLRHDLREAIAAVLADRPVAAARTRAVGCAIGAGAGAPAAPPKLESGIGTVSFPVTTRVPKAQAYFNQGMARWYGFNFPEAERSFREAARLDPRCAMAHWGIALSLGMTYNFDYNPARLPEAEAAVKRAGELAAGASERERALIRAMAVRHAPGTEMAKQLQPYHAAMADVYLAHREDVNVAVLYAASGMDLRPWRLWERDGRPAPGTVEILLVLEDALRRSPNHIGANHYFVHAVEASPHPERALPSTGRLAAQAPRSGHLVHMPSHTFIRLGEYRAASVTNRRAADVDAAYFREVGKATAYGGYYFHNLDFLVAALTFEGRSQQALAASRELARAAAQYAPEVWGMSRCGNPSGIMYVLARFARWDEILAAPPAAENPFSQLAWRYARGMAQAAKGRPAEAERELQAVIALEPEVDRALPPPVPGMTEGMAQAARIPRHHLAGRLAAARGDSGAAIEAYRKAIELEDAIPYLEPPLWRHPPRESLGALYLKLDRAPEAEALFREQLRLTPKNGRALFGLRHALERQGKSAEAAAVRERFQAAWARADTKLEMDHL